jgi:hypothetical protein
MVPAFLSCGLDRQPRRWHVVAGRVFKVRDMDRLPALSHGRRLRRDTLLSRCHPVLQKPRQVENDLGERLPFNAFRLAALAESLRTPRPFQHQKLMAQGQILEDQISAGFENGRGQAQQES